jgi:hypothetical protein
VLRPARLAKKKGRLTRRPSGRNGDLELEIAIKPHALFGFDAQRRLQCVLVLIAQPVFPRQLSGREALYLRALASDLEQSGYARCAVVAAWGASAEEYLARAGRASTRPHSAHAKRRDQR